MKETTYDLRFDPGAYVTKEIVVNGTKITYRSYENIIYVRHPVDLTFHSMNIYVPESAIGRTDVPIFFRNYVGGYMSTPPIEPNISHPILGPGLAYALYRGYVAVSPGTRGREDKVGDIYTGKAPADIVDLKAAVRYLRYNSDVIPGNTERIYSDGSSAGGAMSALLGVTGNNPDYEPYLQELGAAEERDDVYASVCFCPIIDLEHSNGAYEWLFGQVTKFDTVKPRPSDGELIFDRIHVEMDDQTIELSKRLSKLFCDYINGLRLRHPETRELLTLENDGEDGSYLDYMLQELGRSASEYLAGQQPEDREKYVKEHAWLDYDPATGNASIPKEKFREYIQSVSRMKPCPAFDGLECEITENSLFGTKTVPSNHFDDMLETATGNTGRYLVPDQIRHNIKLMNPMAHINESKNSVAKYFYIRVGSLDCDHSYTASMNLSLALKNSGKCQDVNYKLAWLYRHDGDYCMDELFDWFEQIK